MEAHGGMEQFLSCYCIGAFVPKTDDADEKYELMAGMHMAMEDELDLMLNTINEAFEDHKTIQTKRSGFIDYWLN